jgi:hypothetical protein
MNIAAFWAFLTLLASDPAALGSQQAFSALWQQAQTQVASATPSPAPSAAPTSLPATFFPLPTTAPTAAPSSPPDRDGPGQEPPGGDGDGPTASPVAFSPAPQSIVSQAPNGPQTDAPNAQPTAGAISGHSGPTTNPAPSAAPWANPTPWTFPSQSPMPAPSSSVASPTSPPAAMPTQPLDQFPPGGVLFPAWRGNHPVGSNPALASNSAAIIANLARNGHGNITSPSANDQVTSYWTARSSDPQVTINAQNSPSISGVSIPAGAAPAGNSDKHISILQPDGVTLVECWEFNNGNAYTGGGSVSCASAQKIALDGDGFSHGNGWPVMAAGSSTRLGYSSMAELNAGVIPHAIEATPACSPNSSLMGQATTPLGQNCNSGGGPGIAAGQYLWSDVPASALPASLDNATRMICTAFNRFGAVVGDTNGNWNSISLNGLGSPVGTDASAYANWTAANMNGRSTDIGACFPGGWQQHIHVLA